MTAPGQRRASRQDLQSSPPGHNLSGICRCHTATTPATLLPLDLVVRSGYSPRWLGNHLRDAERSGPPGRAQRPSHDLPLRDQAGRRGRRSCLRRRRPATEQRSRRLRRDAPSRRPAGAADCLVGAGRLRRHAPDGRPAGRHLSRSGCSCCPCPGRRDPEVAKTLAADLRRLEDWLARACRRRTAAGAAPADRRPASGAHRRLPCGAAARRGVRGRPGPSATTPSCASIEQAGRARLRPGVVHLARPLEALAGAPVARRRGRRDGRGDGAGRRRDDRRPSPPTILDIGMCPRRSTADRRDHLARRLDEARPSSIIYARQSFCDPGAYDALLVARLAEERGLPYLEIEVDFPLRRQRPAPHPGGGLPGGPAARRRPARQDDLGDDDLFGDGPCGDRRLRRGG